MTTRVAKGRRRADMADDAPPGSKLLIYIKKKGFLRDTRPTPLPATKPAPPYALRKMVHIVMKNVKPGSSPARSRNR